MDVIHPRTDVIRIMEVLEGAQKLHIGPRRFYGDDVGIHGGYGLDDVVELGIAHMRVYLGRVLNASGRQAAALDGPTQLDLPAGAPPRQPCAKGRLDVLNAGQTGQPQARAVATTTPDYYATRWISQQ